MRKNDTIIELRAINDNCMDLLQLIKQLQDQMTVLTEELIKKDLEDCLRQIGFPVDEAFVQEIVNNGIFKSGLQ